jgi:phosphoenolpyruvate-protein kinase (PTS system EI component)
MPKLTKTQAKRALMRARNSVNKICMAFPGTISTKEMIKIQDALEKALKKLGFRKY